MGVAPRVVVGIVLGLLYAVPTIADGHVAPGIVGGVLAAVLGYLVLTRFGEQQRARQRRRRDR